MVYYSVNISSQSQYKTNIVTEFFKYIYNTLPMCLSNFVDIFQDKLYKILSDIAVVKTYIYYILLLRN